jgi:hypothetical protein
MAGGGEGGLERTGLGECPAGKGRGLGTGGFAEADLGVAVLKFFHNFVREGAAAGDLAEVFGHLAEGVGGPVSEEKDSCLVGLRHAWIILSDPCPTHSATTGLSRERGFEGAGVKGDEAEGGEGDGGDAVEESATHGDVGRE